MFIFIGTALSKIKYYIRCTNKKKERTVIKTLDLSALSDAVTLEDVISLAKSFKAFSPLLKVVVEEFKEPVSSAVKELYKLYSHTLDDDVYAKTKASGRRRQYEAYSEAGFSRGEAILLMAADSSRESAVAAVIKLLVGEVGGALEKGINPEK